MGGGEEGGKSESENPLSLISWEQVLSFVAVTLSQHITNTWPWLSRLPTFWHSLIVSRLIVPLLSINFSPLLIVNKLLSSTDCQQTSLLYSLSINFSISLLDCQKNSLKRGPHKQEAERSAHKDMSLKRAWRTGRAGAALSTQDINTNQHSRLHLRARVR